MAGYRISNTSGIALSTDNEGISIPTTNNVAGLRASGVPTGSLIFSTTDNQLYSFNGTSWVRASTSGSSGTSGTSGSSGTSGTSGSSGTAGTSGSSGTSGLQGPAGPQGAQGPQGFTGPQGAQGPQGIQGPQGVQGPSGSSGTSGTSGSSGTAGTSGSSGTAGTSGTSGSSGTSGTSGSSGTSGTSGSSGTSGTSGGQGGLGPQGPQGPIGPGGPQGNTGPQGPQGPQGNAGSSGTSGTTGTSGTSGGQGPQGNQGPQGAQGPQGNTGPQGPQGPQGPGGGQGPGGSSGTSGTSGAQGPSGTSGTSGNSGTSGTSGTSVAVSGTTNTVTKFTSSTTIGNSNIIDNGTVIGNGINTYVIGQTTNGQSYYQWVPSDYYPPNTFSISLLVRKDHSATGISNSVPALTLYNGNGGLNTTVQLSFATPEEATSAGNSIPLAGLIAKKERAGTINNWTDGSLTIFTKNGSVRNDAIFISHTGLVGINTSNTGSYQLQVAGTGYFSSILYLDGGSNSVDNLRAFNTDGNYFRIRQTSASNSNNVWLDPVLGATMWLGWSNGTGASTADTYTEVRVGTGRSNINETVRMRRGDIEGWDSSGNVDFRIVSTGALGSHTYFLTGNVGIGTATPSNKLTVFQGGGVRVTGIANGTYIELSGDLPGYSANAYPVLKSGGTIHFANNDKYSAYLEGNDTYFGILNSGGTTRVFLHTNGSSYLTGGKVGIGTSTPSTFFHQSSYEAANWISTLTNSGTSGHTMYFGYNNGTNTTYGLYITGGLGNANQLDFAVENKFYVNGDGKVGVGISTPTHLLDVVKSQNGVTAVSVRNSSTAANAHAGLYIGNDSSSNAGGMVVFGSLSAYSFPYNPNGTYIYSNQSGGIAINSEAAAPVYIGTNNTSRLYITSAGSVGINTTTPNLHSSTTGLVVRGSARGILELWDATTGKSVFQNVSGDTYIGQLDKGTGSGRTFMLVNGNGSSADIAMTMLANSNVGVGTTTPGYKLDVNGNIRAGSGNSTALLVSATGTATTSAAIAIQQLTTEGDTIIFADYEPYAEYGIIARNSIDSIDFTSGGGSGLTSYSITNRSGNSRTAWVQGRMSLGDGRLYVFNRIGIGTLSANDQLTFAQAADDAIQIRRLTTSEGNPAIGTGISWTWTSAGTDNETWAAIRVIMPGSGNSIMTFSTTSGGGTAGFAERMRVTDGGNLLLGSTTATTTGGFTNTRMLIKQAADGGSGGGLHIEANGSDNVAFFGFTGSAFRIGTSYRSSGSYQPIQFSTNGNVRATVENDGSFTTTRGVYPGYGINLMRQNGARTGISHYNDSYFNWQEYMSPAGTTGCGPNGNLTAPSGLSAVTSWAWRYRMEGVSTYGFLWELGGGGGGDATGSPIMELHATSGTLRVSGDLIAYASDGRLKTNIKAIENALMKVESIRGVEYDWIDGIEEDYGFHPTSKHEVGVIAQEIQAVLPEAVLTAPFNGAYKQKKGEDPNFLTVKYERVVPLLIEAIKELSAQNKKLEEKNREFETILNSLINRQK